MVWLKEIAVHDLNKMAHSILTSLANIPRTLDWMMMMALLFLMN